MRARVALIVIVFTAVSVVGTATVSAQPFRGAENVVCDGLTGLIIWDVSENMDGSWRYAYIFQATGHESGMPGPLPTIEKFCIQVPMTFTDTDVSGILPPADLMIGPVTPTCGGPFYGACFVPMDTELSLIVVTFDSPFAPTYGHFWVELVPDGGGVPTAAPGDHVPMGSLCIPTPSNGTIPLIPEPLTMLALGGGLAPLAVHLRRRWAQGNRI